jgi:hypothetical protein
MARKIIIAFAVLILAIIIFMAFSSNQNKKQATVCFNESCFKVELAISNEQKIKGLMNRKSMANDYGMLFVYDNSGIYNFWMKDTLIPLDIIWINENREAVFIKENAEPCMEGVCAAINPGVESKYVLELNAGSAKKIGLNLSNKLDINI